MSDSTAEAGVEVVEEVEVIEETPAAETETVEEDSDLETEDDEEQDDCEQNDREGILSCRGCDDGADRGERNEGAGRGEIPTNQRCQRINPAPEDSLHRPPLCSETACRIVATHGR